MRAFATALLALTASAFAQMAMDHATPSQNAAAERLGTVSFSVSCAASQQPAFNRGVALLHDFWYPQAQVQFELIEKADPTCAMAHWGVAMSHFHQIWERPDEKNSGLAGAEMEKAQSPAAGTERERAYIGALSDFFKPGKEDYQKRIDAYSEAMGRIYKQYPEDVDAGAFYALSLLAAEKSDDTSLVAEHKAMDVLTPLFARYPDNPGVVHYIIHSCDNPTMAREGLAAADHYGEIAQSGSHAVHMPGHIYSRLGMWPQDAASQLESIAAAESAEKRGEGSLMDEPHSYDFLLYAYLQSGQDANAQKALAQSSAVLTRISAMPEMSGHHRGGMVPMYRLKLPAFYNLEMRDWKSASKLEAEAGSPPQIATLAYWARAIADGHLYQAGSAKADLARYDALVAEIKKGKDAYMADGTGAQIEHNEILGWVAFADGKADDALKHMRDAADLQDKVGQGEVDIPAREMLADMLLELHRPQQALNQYEIALRLSPNRFNGLYDAGAAAEQSGDKAQAERFYSALLKSTDDGAQSERPELAHAKSFLSGTQLAAR